MVKKSHKRRSHKHKSHKHKKQDYTKKNKYNKNKQGGNGSNIINPLNLQSTPNQVYSFPAGSTSATNAAQNYLSSMSQQQNELNHNLHNGGGGKKGNKRKQKGGIADINVGSGAGAGDYYSCEAQNPNFTTVAQFSSSGPDVSPLNANNSSITTNATSIAGKNNATNDCYASGTCQEVDCPASAGEAATANAGANEAGAAAETTTASASANEVGAVTGAVAAPATPPQSGGRGGSKKRRMKRKGKKSKKNKKN